MPNFEYSEFSENLELSKNLPAPISEFSEYSKFYEYFELSEFSKRSEFWEFSEYSEFSKNFLKLNSKFSEN